MGGTIIWVFYHFFGKSVRAKLKSVGMTGKTQKHNLIQTHFVISVSE